MADGITPPVFINVAGTKAAKMFSLAHELAHIWFGESAISGVDPISTPSHAVEAWCNQVASKLLVPLASLREEIGWGNGLSDEVRRFARHCKVSTLVVLRRIFDTGTMDRRAFKEAYHNELNRLKAIPAGSGGSFHATLKARAGRRFRSALAARSRAGRMSFSEAFCFLGIKKTSTLRKFVASLKVA